VHRSLVLLFTTKDIGRAYGVSEGYSALGQDPYSRSARPVGRMFDNGVVPAPYYKRTMYCPDFQEDLFEIHS